MKKRRLLKLADLLDADAKRKRGVKFDTGTWGHTDSAPVAMDCGTHACALGLAVLSGAFKRAGLYNANPDCRDLEPGFRRLGKPPVCGHEAAMALFEIDAGASVYLFGSMSYFKRTGAVAERAVAKRIRAFVKSNGTRP